MRTLSATQIKLKMRGRKTRGLQVKPREGTYLRTVYDAFMKAPGKPIEIMPEKGTVQQLRIAYGLDVRMLKQGYNNGFINHKSLWVLAGEWFGSIYIDYTAENEEQMDRLAEARYALEHVEHIDNILPDGIHHLSKDSQDILERVAAKGREIAKRHMKENNNG